MSQSKIDAFFPTVKGNKSGKLNTKALRSPRKVASSKVLKFKKKMSDSPRMKRTISQEDVIPQKFQKIDSSPVPSKGNISRFTGESFRKSRSQSLLELQSETILQSPQRIQRSSSFSPKKSPRSPAKKTRISLSPRKIFGENLDSESVRKAIENFNLHKQGAIVPNDFDLEKIYASSNWKVNYRSLRTDEVNKFELKDIIVPKEKHADHLFTIIIDVFSSVMNCGYFDERELDLIFSTLTLSAKTQMLLARLLKRKLSWHRVAGIQYPEIASNLHIYFNELVEKGFCDSNIEAEEVPSLLRILQLDDIRKLCQKLKVDHKGSKTTMIEKLLQLNSKQKTWFVGAKSPSSVLKSSIIEALGYCVRLSNNTISVFERIFTLLIPCQDPTETISDLFLMLTRVKNGEILFPTTPKERLPIFRNREHLLGFVEARNVLKELLEAIENKDWETVKKNGRLAFTHLSLMVKKEIQDNDEEEKSMLPSHVKKYFPNCVWTKVLSKSIDAFKKSQETIEEAVTYLKALINQKNYGTSYLGRWYKELSLIEMHHRKDLQTSAILTLEALSQENLTEVDVMDLLERAKKLARRKTGINKETKDLIKDVLENVQRELPPEFDVVNEIEAYMVAGNVTGSKSTWSIDIGGENRGYTRVEQIALRHYHKEGYPRGIHCEGSLPLSLFTVLFWNELYDIAVPGAFVTPYQGSPLDLFTSHFFENRREKLESKIKFIRSLDNEVFGDLMEDFFLKFKDFRSMISSNLFESDQHFKEVAMCLGTTGVVGICERLATNFNLWKAGFPDLFLWNPLTNECKIVEVKGPGDSLSTKQKLWLQYLQRIGVRAEVCVVKAKSKNGRRY